MRVLLRAARAAGGCGIALACCLWTSSTAQAQSDPVPPLPPVLEDVVHKGLIGKALDVVPMDLFKSERNKRIWDLKISHLGRNYDVVGVFNFDETRSRPTYLSWKDLGLLDEQPVHVYDFWHKEYLGAWENGITVDLLPASARALLSAVGEKSSDKTSSPCSASHTPLRPSPSATASAVCPRRSRCAWRLRKAFGSVPK